jgi:type IV secretory pathway TrbF-like protein
MGGPVVWRAMLRTLVQAPKTAEAMKANPIGLTIDELHWDKVGG